jgi:hypothetical protein
MMGEATWEIIYAKDGELMNKYVRAYTQEEAEEKSGVPAEDIRSVYKTTVRRN